MSKEKQRAPRNRTLDLTEKDRSLYKKRIITLKEKVKNINDIINKTILGDSIKILPLLPQSSVDLIFVDPPYNLSKDYNGKNFNKMSEDKYLTWLEEWIPLLHPILKDNGSLYICCDWTTSPLIYNIGRKYFTPLNRITWEREKGRGSKSNWKNCAEDIWFFAKSKNYTFNLDAVKVQRKVIAPYVDKNRKPKDWSKGDGGNFRITHPSNIWTDITIPFWSMRENTDHPTQKSEKLLAKIILASTNENDCILDPFLGSGTTSVTAKKLNRRYIGIELNEEYCLLCEKRLEIAKMEKDIQGFIDGIFWERNSVPAKPTEKPDPEMSHPSLF